jgi:uncharacterized membrane protein YraQ (UPF0718 family)
MIALARRHSTLLALSAITLLAVVLVRVLKGPDAVAHAWDGSVDLIIGILPSMLAGMLMAGSLRQLVPTGALAKWMGKESGWKGLVIASAVGMGTPGGPMAAFPMVLVLSGAGADIGCVISFIVSWGLNGMNRILVWEVPLLGPDFALLRFLSGLPMGFIAGWISRRMPLRWAPPEGLPR